MNSHYHMVDGLRYRVTEWGVGEPLLLLHGFTGSGATWQPLAARFEERYRVIAVDLPGHGATDAPPDDARYRMERVVADLAHLLAVLEATPAHWLGYSMGGRLALYATVRLPAHVRAAVLESASPGLATAAERQARREQDEALARRIEAEGIAAFVDYWEHLPLFATQLRLPAQHLAEQRAARLLNSANGLAGSLRGMGTGSQPSLWDSLAGLTIPGLLLVGELDEKFAAINRRIAETWATAELEVVSGAGHAIHLERPDAFAALVLDFLARVSERDGQNLTQRKKRNESKRGERHLLEPRVESGQVVGSADRHAVAVEQRNRQEK